MLLRIGPDPFFPQSSPGHSPKLIFHIMKSRDQTSVLLSVEFKKIVGKNSFIGRVFFYISRLMSPQLLREMPVMHDAKGILNPGILLSWNLGILISWNPRILESTVDIFTI